MSDIIKTDSSSSLPANVDIDTLKSMYYWLNAKPDTHIKVFAQAKLVNNDDIIDLNSKVQSKLSIHHHFTNITSITVSLEKGEIKSFNAWEVFRNHHWEVPERIESISINWDITVELPGYKLPQKHTLKVRIGSSLRPNELFHIITNGDDEIELRENLSFIVCKVDFINVVISRELINIVETWYNALQKLHPKSKFQKFLETQKSIVARVGHYLTTSIGLALLFIFFKIHLSKITINTFDKDIYLDIVFWMILFLLTYFTFNIIGSSFGQLIYEKIDKYESPHYFAITKGDKNEQVEINRKNKKISSNLIWQFLIRFVVAMISLVISKFLLHK